MITNPQKPKKAKPKQRQLGAKVFALLQSFKRELQRRDAKDAWELRTAQLEKVERVAQDLRELRDKEAKAFLESPKFRRATQERLRRAKKKNPRLHFSQNWWQRKGRFLGQKFEKQKIFST